MTVRPAGVLLLGGCLPPPYGGIAKYLDDTLPALSEQGFRFWVWMRRSANPPDYRERERPGLTVITPSGGRWRRALLALPMLIRYWPWLIERCRRFGLPWREALSTLTAWLPDADDFMRRHGTEIDIIHVFDAPWEQGWIGTILARKYRKRLMITIFGELVPHRDPIEPVDAQSAPYLPFSRHVLQAYDRIAAPTRYCAHGVRLLDLDAGTVRVTYHASGMDLFKAPPPLPQPFEDRFPELAGRRFVLFAGQLLPRKGPDVLLRAAARFLKDHPEHRVVLIGPDLGMRPELEGLANGLGIADKCLFAGAVSNLELAHCYQRADVFVFPTVSPIECLGLVFVQAMFAGCPVVASRISGVPEVLQDEENGLLFEPGDHTALADRVSRLLRDDVERQRLAEQAKRDVARQFPESVILEQAKALYAE